MACGAERKAGPRSVGHAQRVLSPAYRDAVRHRLVVKKVARAQGTPKLENSQVDVVGMCAQVEGSQSRSSDAIDQILASRGGA